MKHILIPLILLKTLIDVDIISREKKRSKKIMYIFNMKLSGFSSIKFEVYLFK